MKDQLYTITVNMEQLMLISQCIEDICRFAAGQPELHHTVNALLINHDDFCEKREEIEEHLYAIKKIIYPKMSKNESYGYNGGPQSDPIRRNLIANTYQIYREILHFLAEDENWGNVYNAPTLKSGDLGVIKVVKLKNENT